MPDAVPDAELEHAMRYVLGLGLVRDVWADRLGSGTADRRGERRRVTVVWLDDTSDDWPAGKLMAYYRGVRDALAVREVVPP